MVLTIEEIIAAHRRIVHEEKYGGGNSLLEAHKQALKAPVRPTPKPIAKAMAGFNRAKLKKSSAEGKPGSGLIEALRKDLARQGLRCAQAESVLGIKKAYGEVE